MGALNQIVLGLATGLTMVGVGVGTTLQGPRKWAVMVPYAALTLLGVYLLANAA